MRAARLTALLLLALAGQAAAQADDYFARVDVDGDNRVSLDEFLLKMSWAFSQRDLNGNEILDPDEQHVANAQPITLAEHRARFGRQFAKQDVDGDGFLSRREFLAPPR